MEWMAIGLALVALAEIGLIARLRYRLDNLEEVGMILIEALIREGVIEEVTKGDLAMFDGEDWLEEDGE